MTTLQTKKMILTNNDQTQCDKLTKKMITLSLFLVPALLLSTPNFSVAVIAILALYAIGYCFFFRKDITLNKRDWLVLATFSSYFIVNLPNVMIDIGNFRYIEGPSKILLSFPVYLMFKRELPTLNVRPWLEYGVIAGAIGAFSIACYQYFFLGFPRVDGFLFSINFGYLACSLAALNLCLTPNSKHKLLLITGFILASIATILTLTRGAIIALPVLMLVFLFLNRASLKKRYVFLSLLLALLASTLAVQLSSGIKNRIDFTIAEVNSILSGNSKDALSSGARLNLWYAAVQATIKSPLKGLTYPERTRLNQELVEQGKVIPWVAGVGRGHAHSQYFEMLASNGLPALPAMGLLLLVPLVLLSRSKQHIFVNTGFVFMIGICIFGLTEVLLQANLISTYFGMFLAFFLASCSPQNAVKQIEANNSLMIKKQ